MDGRAYWIWLQQAFGAGSKKPTRLNTQYPGGVEEFCLGGPKLWNVRRDLTDKEAASLQAFSLSQAEARLEYAEKLGWLVLTPDCEKYPEALRNIPAPPAVLYVKGNLPDVDAVLSIAVVGSRHATPEVQAAARRFGYQLAASGACVVSGSAQGVDSEAQTGALSLPGSRVISVRPVSLDSSHPVQNAKLRDMICQRGGALVSEYFSMGKPELGTYSVRNRLITGLCRGVVLLQAAPRSGTMIYASHALDQNRDVFVYPGPEDSLEFAGSRELLADGARKVICGEDVIAEYDISPGGGPPPRLSELLEDLPLRRPEKRTRTPREKAPALADSLSGLSPQSRQVLEALGREPLSVGRLEESTGLPASALLGILTELEVEGVAESLPGKRYIRRL